MAKQNVKEDWLQYVAAEYLRYCGCVFLHIPNEGKRSVQGHAMMIAKGLQPGAHDLLILLEGGTTIWIELKTATGPIRPAQIKWADTITKMGYHQYLLKTSDTLVLCSELERILLAHKYNARCAKSFLASRPQFVTAC